tara:strand:+ start:476 stop:793 length:318 start_codon:yes stop_codon:yes gene_type:complete
MRVIDHQEQEWFLFEHEGKLYLDANCNHSFVGYSYMIELDDSERMLYESGGHDYLSKLAYDIHYSAPIVIGSQSNYIGRDETKSLGDLATEAVRSWRNGHEQGIT